MRLYPDIVDSFFNVCLFCTGENPAKMVEVEGINKVQFHADRLKSLEVEIIAMLNELPDKFKKSSGEGCSFLEACNDKHGEQWTGLHQHMEQLFLLGMGIGKVKPLFPRKLWSTLPGEMPYYVIE